MELVESGSRFWSVRTGQTALHTVGLTDDDRWVEVVRHPERPDEVDTIVLLAPIADVTLTFVPSN